MNISWLLGQIFGNGGIVVLLFIALWILVKGDRKLAYRTLVALVITFVVTHLIKYFFPVPRPFVSGGIDVPFSFVSGTDSFPSGHASLAFAIATSIWLGRHKLGAVSLLVATLVAIGRVLMLVHYPIDVIVGALIGATVSIVVSVLTNPNCPIRSVFSTMSKKNKR